MAAEVYLRCLNSPIPAANVFAALRRYDVGAVNHVMLAYRVRDGRRETMTMSFSSRLGER